MERQKKLDRIVWVLRIVEETLKKILNPVTWEVYFPSISERVSLLSLHCILDFNWFLHFGSECAWRHSTTLLPPPPCFPCPKSCVSESIILVHSKGRRPHSLYSGYKVPVCSRINQPWKDLKSLPVSLLILRIGPELLELLRNWQTWELLRHFISFTFASFSWVAFLCLLRLEPCDMHVILFRSVNLLLNRLNTVIIGVCMHAYASYVFIFKCIWIKIIKVVIIIYSSKWQNQRNYISTQ